MKRIWIWGLCLGALWLNAFAGLSADSLSLNTPVVDKAGILSAAQIQMLDKKIRGWYVQGLMQAGVVIVNTTGNQDDFTYAMQLFERWQLGNKKQDNGLLLLVVMDKHQLRLITGYGLEGALPDISAKAVIRDDITPYFKQQQYAKGIENGLIAVARRLQADPQHRAEQLAADQKTFAAQQNDSEIRFPLFMFVTAFLSFFLRRYRLRYLLLPLIFATAALGYFVLAVPLPLCILTAVFMLLVLFSKDNSRFRNVSSAYGRFYRLGRNSGSNNSSSNNYRGLSLIHI